LTFLTPKSIYFLHLYKIPDRWIYHTAILILGSKFGFGLSGPIFTFMTSKNIYFFDLYKISDRLMGRMAYFFLELRKKMVMIVGAPRLP
jgi:hypothetical protein